MVEIGAGALGGEQDQPKTLLAPPLLEFRPGVVTLDRHLIEIIHPGTAEVPVRHRKAGRLDNVGLNIQAGAEPQNRAGILRDVGLEQGNAHSVTTLLRFQDPGGVSDMDDPNVVIFHTVRNAVWVLVSTRRTNPNFAGESR